VNRIVRAPPRLRVPVIHKVTKVWYVIDLRVCLDRRRARSERHTNRVIALQTQRPPDKVSTTVRPSVPSPSGCRDSMCHAELVTVKELIIRTESRHRMFVRPHSSNCTLVRLSYALFRQRQCRILLSGQDDRAGSGSWTENFGAVRSIALAPFRAERRMQLYET